jgi:hypothetical protein
MITQKKPFFLSQIWVELTTQCQQEIDDNPTKETLF